MPKRTVRDNPKPFRPGKPKPINDLLAKSALLGGAVRRFEARQTGWEGFFAGRLSPELAREISHYVERDGTLTVFASSAAWSARLRFVLAEHWPAIVAHSPTLKRWVVRVQPAAASTGART